MCINQKKKKKERKLKLKTTKSCDRIRNRPRLLAPSLGLASPPASYLLLPAAVVCPLSHAISASWVAALESRATPSTHMHTHIDTQTRTYIGTHCCCCCLFNWPAACVSGGASDYSFWPRWCQYRLSVWRPDAAISVHSARKWQRVNPAAAPTPSS